MIHRLRFALALLLTAAGAAEHAPLLTVFGQRKLALTLPAGFTLDQAPEVSRGLTAVRLSGPKDAMNLQLFFVPDPTGGELARSARARKEFLVREFQAYVGSSTEQAMQFEEFDERNGSAGTYCAFTDSALLGKPQLPPNEFLHVTVGLRAWPDGCALFKLFSHDLISAEYRALLAVMRDGLELKPLTPLK
ncbi:MAG: hypothetical protein HZA93_26140 [Verrucomicrobia bacterium]|nr:hypothetical protein [Verrucomicrobiota bacterium]